MRSQVLHNALIDFNKDDFPRLKFRRAVELFEAQAKKSPAKTAVEFGDKKLSYGKLNDQADNVSFILSGLLKKDQRKIYVLADNNPWMITAFLGILKSNNIFVPLNPKYPAKIIKEIFDDVGPDFFIIEQKYADFLKREAGRLSGLKVLMIDKMAVGSFRRGKLVLDKIASREQFRSDFGSSDQKKSGPDACIYFTSGSTGRFKAVLMNDLCLSFGSELAIRDYLTEQSRVSHFFSVYMHTSLTRGIMPALCAGATLCIPENDFLLLNISDTVKWLEEKRINLISLPTPLFKFLAEEIKRKNQLRDLKYILVMADKLNRGRYLENFFNKAGSRINLINLYGSTEAPVGFRHRVSRVDLKKDIVPVGRSLAAKAIVLDENKKVLMPGTIGEIYIRSPFLASGYYNDPAQTSQKFIKNPFSKRTGDIIYRTGDLGRLLPNGSLECLGRVDQQVKIGGKRLDLGAVEAVMQRYRAIKDSVVVVKGSSLTAYFTAKKEFKLSGFKKYLKNSLPDFMIPNYLIRLSKLPLTANGKINRRALAEPHHLERKDAKNSYFSATEIERRLIKIWQQVLGSKSIGVNDNFFDAGGNSLKIVEMNKKIKDSLAADLPALTIFKYPTIKMLAGYLEKKDSQQNNEIQFETRTDLLSLAIKSLRRGK